MDKPFRAATGFGKHLIEKVRLRRRNPLQAKRSTGLIKTIRKTHKRQVANQERRRTAYGYWASRCQPQNLGAGKFNKDVARTGGGKSYDEHIKCYPPEGYYAFFLSYKEWLPATERPLSFSAFMREKPFWVRSERKVVSCICCYHRSMAIRVRALNKARAAVHHRMKRKKPMSECPCVHSGSCECACEVCKQGPFSQLRDYQNCVMCPRQPRERNYKLQCVLGECADCGFQKNIAAICPREKSCKSKWISVKLLNKVEGLSAKGKKKKFLKETTEEMTYEQFLKGTEDETKTFLIHDYIARTQGDLYHDMFSWLPEDTELWVRCRFARIVAF